MTTTNTLSGDFASSMQQMTTAAPTTMNPTATISTVAPTPHAGTGGVDSIMRKMAEQQQMISQLNVQLQKKSDDVQKLSEKQLQEMKHVYETVIAKWVDMQDGVNQATRDQFKTGIERLADKADDNGI